MRYARSRLSVDPRGAWPAVAAKKGRLGARAGRPGPLDLSPGRKGLTDLIADNIRKVLSGVTTATEGIGALRTHGGDAHGRERGHRRIDPRIARFAIHAASTVALFLIETWERKMQRSLPAEPTE